MRILRYIFPAFVFGFTFCVYLSTLAPTVFWQDSGIYLAGIKTGGIVYPPGFPLYMILAVAFTNILFFVPLTTAVHIFSAVCSSLACVFIYFSLLKLFSSKDMYKSNISKESIGIVDYSLAIAGGILSGLNYNVWAQAINSEVYALNTLFFTLILYLIILLGSHGRINREITETQKRIILYINVFYGLSFGNHPATIALIPVLLYLVWISRNIFFNTKLVLSLLGIFIFCALITYVYIPVRASMLPKLNWGNPNSINRFFNYVLAKDYLTNENSFVLFDATRLIQILSEFKIEFGLGGFVLALFGGIYLLRREKDFGSTSWILIITLVFLTYIYRQETEFNFWLIPVHLTFLIWLLIGMRAIFKINFVKTKFPAFIAVILAVAGLFVVFGGRVYANFEELNRSRYYMAEDFGKNILRNLEPNSLLLMTGDQESATTLYLQMVENYRTDVLVLKNIDFRFMADEEGRKYLKKYYPKLKVPDSNADLNDTENYFAYLNKLVLENLKERPVYLMSRNLFDIDETQFSLIPAAAMWRVVKPCKSECMVDLKYWNLRYSDVNYFKKKERELMSVKDLTSTGGLKRQPFIQHMINFEKQSWKNLGDWYAEYGACEKATVQYKKAEILNNIYSTFNPAESLKSCISR